MQTVLTSRRHASWAGALAAACGVIGFVVDQVAGPDGADGWLGAVRVPAAAASILAVSGAALILVATGKSTWGSVIGRLGAITALALSLLGLVEVLPLWPSAAIGFALSSVALFLVGRERSTALTASTGLALAAIAVCLITASADLLPLSGTVDPEGGHMSVLADLGLVRSGVGFGPA